MKPTQRQLRRLSALGTLLTTAIGASACDQVTPTSIDDSQFPAAPVTVEVQLDWADFAKDLQVYGGYGTPRDLPAAVLAHTFAGSLESRMLLRWAAYPPSVQAVNEDGSTVPDLDPTFISGRVIAKVDTAASNLPGPVLIVLGEVQDEWDENSATWTHAVDTLGDQRVWSQPGAGPLSAPDTAYWDPSFTDSIIFNLDSTTIAAWGDTIPEEGFRLEVVTDGSLIELSGIALRLDARPSINPDTVVQTSIGTVARTFVYDPQPIAPGSPANEIRVGGVPAWRSAFEVTMSKQLTGPPALCALVGCPYDLQPRHITRASLALTTRSVPTAYQPQDSVALDARSVLSPATGAKSPLGPSLVAGLEGLSIDPGFFDSSGAGAVVELPITQFMQSFVGGLDAAGRPPPTTLSLLSLFEPFSLSYAAFEIEPRLNLILTLSPPVELP